MHIPRSLLAQSLMLLIAVAACGPLDTEDGGGRADDSGGPPDAPGAETLGQPCLAACGANDDKKCAMPDSDCGSEVCLVDHTQSLEHSVYCTIDCGSSACPDGWHCEDIKSFEDLNVRRACIADPANCGDGVVQLGEDCDGGEGCTSDCESEESPMTETGPLPATCEGFCQQHAGAGCDDPIAGPECASECEDMYGAGCDAELDAWIACSVAGEITCGEYGPTVEGCADEAVAYGHCSGII